MEHFTFERVHHYANNGQDVERSIRYALTGRTEKADNIPFTLATDCLQYQIKGARATVCKGTDIRAHIERDKATAYIYGSNDNIAYVMSPAEYIEFVERFGTVTRESNKNGGAVKTRLKAEGREMKEWLAGR